MYIDRTKWFYIGSNLNFSGGGAITSKIEYDIPFGEDVEVDCGEVGQASSTFSATTGILNAPVKEYGLIE